MAKILMQLDETDSAIITLKNEAGNILVFLQNLYGFDAPFGGSWWTGAGADRFFGDLNNCINELKKFAPELQAFYERVNQELTEWTDVDTSYSYMITGIEYPKLDFNNLTLFSYLDYLEQMAKLELKVSVSDLLGSALPWRMRYPPEAETETSNFLGLSWETETTYGNWDAGLYGGLADEGYGAGLFAEGNMWEKVSTASLFGIPLVFTATGPSYEAKGGTTGAEVALSYAGWNLNIAGFNVGFDLGLGFGTDGNGVKLGPFSTGFNPGVAADAIPSDPVRPPY
ncbi:MAG: hypothetical protein WBM17_14320 [Anaerolineales bacterium]